MKATSAVPIAAVVIGSVACASEPAEERQEPTSKSEHALDVVMQNTGVCAIPGSVRPELPGEAGHVLTTRLVPPSYPFLVGAVEYDLTGPAFSPFCDPSLPHDVIVFVGRSATTAPPTPNPSSSKGYARLHVPAGDNSTSDRTIHLALPSVMTLAAGQQLFVSVQMASNSSLSRSVCVKYCSEPSPELNLDYWSNAAAEPYAWADLVSAFGFHSNQTTRALGGPTL